MHSRSNWKFSRKAYFSKNRAFIAVHVWLLNHEAKACLSLRGKSDYIDKLLIPMTNIMKNRNFSRSFRLKFSLFKQSSVTLLVQVRTTLKVFKVVLAINTENTQ